MAIPNTDIPKTIFNSTTVYDYLRSGDVTINNNNFYDNSLSNPGGTATGIGYTTDGSNVVVGNGFLTSFIEINTVTNSTINTYSWSFSTTITYKANSVGDVTNKIVITNLNSTSAKSTNGGLNFPNIYQFALGFCINRCTGTSSASQYIVFGDTEYTYTLSCCVGVRVKRYISKHTLSIKIGDNIIIDNWSTSIPNTLIKSEAKFITSKPFTVKGEQLLTISSTIPDGTSFGTITFSTICITGLSINKYVDG